MRYKRIGFFFLFMAVSLTPFYGQSQTYLSENFENVSSGLPAGWVSVGPGTVQILNGTNQWYQTEFVHNGSQSLMFSGATSNVVALPALSVPINTTQVTLWTRAEMGSSSCGTLEVGYITDISDASSFVAVTNVSWSECPSNFIELVVQMNSAPANARIAFRHQPLNDFYFWFCDDVTVEAIPSCFPVTNLAAYNQNGGHFLLTWTDDNNSDATYIIYNMDDNSVVASDITTHYYSVYHLVNPQLSPLTPGTVYNFGVAAQCSPTEISSIRTVSKQSAVIVSEGRPYNTGFEYDSDVSWVFANDANGWCIGDATNNGGSRALYISDDAGVSNAYNTGITSCSYAYKAFYLTPIEYTVSYDWKGGGESNFDYLRVFLVPSSVVINAGASNYIGPTNTPNGWIALDGGSKLNMESSWQHVQQNFTPNLTGGYYLLFYWHNDNSMGTQPPVAIDNISISASDGSCLLNLPYTEGFESVGATAYDTEGNLPTCWLPYSLGSNGTSPLPHVVSGDHCYTYSGSKSLAFTCGGSGDTLQFALMPPFGTLFWNVNAQLHSYQHAKLQFWMCTESSTAGTLDVENVGDEVIVGNSVTTFSYSNRSSIPASLETVYCGTDGLQPVGTGKHVSVTLNGFNTEERRLAFLWKNSGATSTTCCIDDISVTVEDEGVCNPKSIPYSENFESSSATSLGGGVSSDFGHYLQFIPRCWDVTHSESYWSEHNTMMYSIPHVVYKTSSHTFAVHGSHGLCLTQHPNRGNYALMPVMARPLNELKISFWMGTEHSYGSTVTVGYVTADDTSTFTPIASYAASTSTEATATATSCTGGQTFTLDLSALPSTATRLAFKSEGLQTSYIDDIVIEESDGGGTPPATCSQTIPYYEGFEGYDAVDYFGSYNLDVHPFPLPNCWDGVVTSDVNNETGSDGYGHTCYYKPHVVTNTTSLPLCWSGGTQSLELVAASNSSTFALLPPMASPLNQLQLMFWMGTNYYATGAGTLTVGYVTSDNAGTFVPLQSFPATEATQVEDLSAIYNPGGKNIMINLGNVPSTATRIAFKWENTADNTTAMLERPLCFIDDISVTAAGSDKVSFVTVCSEYYQWGWYTYTRSGVYHQYANQDHEILYLNIQTPITYSSTVCTQDNSYTWHDNILTFSGDYLFYYSLDDVFCYVDTLHLTVGGNCCPPVTTLPYTEDFEGVTGVIYLGSTNTELPMPMPNCWDVATTAPASPMIMVPHVMTAGTSYGNAVLWHSGANSLGMCQVGDNYAFALLPPISTPLNQLQLRFWLGTLSPYGGTLTVGYVTNDDYSTFTEIQDYPASTATLACIHDHDLSSPCDGGSDIVLNLSGVPATATRLAFRWNRSSDCFIDDINLDVPSATACLPAQNVEVIDAQTDYVTLRWTDPNGNASYTVSHDGNTDATNITAGADGYATCTIQNLTQATKYTFLVTGTCSNGNYSDAASVVAFTTQCEVLQNLQTTAGTNHINISWEDPTNGGISYTVMQFTDDPNAPIIHLATDVHAGSDGHASYTIYNLTPNTDYSFGVAGSCYNNYIDTFDVPATTAACSRIETLPYVQDFESGTPYVTGNPSSNIFIDCMTRLYSLSQSHAERGGEPTIVQNALSHSGNKSSVWTMYNVDDYIMVVLPELNTDLYPVNTLRLSFWYNYFDVRESVSPYIFGVMTDPTNASTFEPVAEVSVQPSLDHNWYQIGANLTGYTGTGRYIAIRANTVDVYWSAMIDDIKLEEIVCPPTTYINATACNSFDWYEHTGVTTSGDYTHTFTTATGCDSVVTLHLTMNACCQPVTNLTVDSVSDTTVSLSWTGSSATYTVMNGSTVVVSGLTDTHYMVTNLTASTSYSFSVIANCSATLSSDPVNITATTDAASCNILLNLGVLDVWSDHVDLHWIDPTNGGISYTLLLLTSDPAHPYQIIGSGLHADATGMVSYTIPNLTPGLSYTFAVAGACTRSVTDTIEIVITTDSTATHNEYACHVPYEWHGVEYTLPGEYYSRNDTLYLSVIYADTAATVCNVFDWYEHIGVTVSGDYTHIFTQPTGCDSVVTLHLTVNACCHPVTNLAVDSVSGTTVSLSWSGTAASYTVMDGTTQVATNITDTYYTVTGLTPATNYIFSVLADCSPSNSSSPVTISATTGSSGLDTIVDLIVVPNDPTMSLHVLGSGSYRVGDTAILAAVANDGFYFVNWKYNNTVLGTDNPFFLIVTLDYTDTIFAMFDTTRCEPVINLMYSDTTSTSVHLVWEDPTNTGATYAVGYFDGSDIVMVSTGISATDYNVTNLTPGMTYHFVVRTDCSASDMVYSTPLTVTMPSPNPISLYDETSRWKLYPNPANTIVTVEAEGMCRVTIYDAGGRVVKCSNVKADSESFDVSGMDNGVYLFRIETANCTAFRKCVVNH